MIAGKPIATPSGYLVDTTLRDGEQTPGVAFDATAKCRIAIALANLGVPEIEVGTPAMGPGERESIRRIVGLSLPARLTAWCRARGDDLAAASTCGVDAVHLSLPASDRLLATIRRDRAWALRQLQDLVPMARDGFAYVSIGLQDASRAERSFLRTLAETAGALGVDRFRLADTVGVWDPQTTAETILLLRQSAGEPDIGFHGHNDLGMATANSVSALRAGASCADVTVLGLGERAGNAPLEEVALALEIALKRSSGLTLTGLPDLCRLVARSAGRCIPVDKPIVGEGLFRHESGIHVHAMLRDETSYEPFAPEKVGQSARRFVLGKHSGRTAIRHLRTQGSSRITLGVDR